MRRRSWIAGMSAAALIAATVPAAAASAPGAVVVRARFTATLPPRFGLDADADGLIDLPNTAEYVAAGQASACGERCAPQFRLQLDAAESSASMGAAPLAIREYRWLVTGEEGRSIVRRGPAPRVELLLPEGRYDVALEVEAGLPWGSARGRISREVVVEDLLVVAVGDSYAAGEGNPERARSSGAAAQWADGTGDLEVEDAHAAAHRSTSAWPALVALALEAGDPGSSVTFVSVAASKAQIAAGLLGPQPGVSDVSQLDQVAALVGERRVDLLLVSIGGNDIGFARIVRGLVDADPVADPVCYATDLENVWEAALDGDWNRGSALRLTLPWGLGCRAVATTGRSLLPGLRGLPGEMDALAQAVSGRLHPAAVYLLAYPDPTAGSGATGPCREIVGDATPPFGFHEIDQAEMAAGAARVVAPLNAALGEAAARHGWRFVAAPEDFGASHGYCAARPAYPPLPAGIGRGEAGTAPAAGTSRWYRPATSPAAAGLATTAGVSWWRTAAQSVALQGPDDAWATTGTLHPNELGQLALAQAVLLMLED